MPTPGAQQQTIVITGATAGIGRALALALAPSAATLLLVGRDTTRGASVLAEAQRAGAGAASQFLKCDLSSLHGMRTLADRVLALDRPLTALIHSAVIFSPTRVVSADRLELMFATNHLAPFTLTLRLLPLLRRAERAAVLTLCAPSSATIHFDDLQAERSFSALFAFGATKAQNLLFSFALARRLENSSVTSNAVHPGVVRTGLVRHANFAVRALTQVIGSTPEKSAAQIAPLITQGVALGSNGQLFHRGLPIKPPVSAHDVAAQELLWQRSEELSGESLALP